MEKKNLASSESSHGTPNLKSAITLTELHRIIPCAYARKYKSHLCRFAVKRNLFNFNVLHFPTRKMLG
jgi:hypothetical protein